LSYFMVQVHTIYPNPAPGGDWSPPPYLVISKIKK
jgi:hypothetical protein